MQKIALITGSNKGIGLEIARQLGQRGIRVLLGVRDTTKGEAAAAALRAQSIEAEVIALDTTSEASVAAALAETASRHKRLDILVNNAGIHLEFSQGLMAPSQLTLDILKATYETNVFGPFLAIRHFLPLLRKSEAGRIVNVSSTMGSLSDQSNRESAYYDLTTLAYNSSKTALNAITIQFAKELAATGIKVNSACPGWVKTDMGSDAAPRTVEQGAQVIVSLATLPADGPTGGFFDENGVVPW